MKTKANNAVIGTRELRTFARVLVFAALFTAPIALNHAAHANYGVSAPSGAGYVLYMTLTRPG